MVAVLTVGSMIAAGGASHAAVTDGVIVDDAVVRQQSPTTNFGSTETLIVRNDIESYVRLDLTKIDANDLALVALKLNKKNSANKIVISQAGEFLTNGGVETSTKWTEASLTWAKKPLDLANTASVSVDVAAGTGSFSVTITKLVTEAKARGVDALTLRLRSTGTVGTDIYSNQASDASLRPAVDVTHGIAEHMVQDNAWVRTTTPTTNYGTAQNLVIGKGGHTYLRLDISQVSLVNLTSVALNLAKYNNAANVVAVRAGEYLSNAGTATSTPWAETTVTWNTRPLDVAGSPVIRAAVPSGTANLALDITELVRAAKNDGNDTLTVHLTTEKVDDQTISGTDIYSTRASNAVVRPWVQVSRTTDEIPVDYPVVQRFDDYRSNGQAAQDVVRISAGSGQYLRVDDSTGTVGVTSDAAAAGLFAVYGYDYTASEYQGTGGGQQTTYAIKSLSNGKYLTIQNYGTAADQPYFTKSGDNYLISATAPTVKWNERFSIKSYPQAGYYTILSHLDALRDGAEATTSPAQLDGTQLSVAPGDRRTHRFTFESVDTSLLEVQPTVTGTSARLAWIPVNDDTDPSHYGVAGGATVSFNDGLMRATVSDLAPGPHALTVHYSGGSAPVQDDVAVRIFNHPGVSLTEQQLDAMRDHVAQKAEPWYSDYLRMKNTVPNSIASLDFQVVARAGVGRGTPEGSGNIRDYEYSSAAAYFDALQWVITGDARYADKTVEILNSWSSTLTQIDGRDQILGAGIATLKLINAAEIVRYYHGGYDGYSDEDFAAFQRLLLNVVYPVIQDAGAPMNANGNWDLAAMVTVEAIGVATDNAGIFDDAIAMYKSPYINGSIVNYVTAWGQTTESARDQAHAQLGVGLMGDLSAIAYHQGENLWSLDDNKLARAYNWAAEFNLFNGEGTLRAEPVDNVFGRTDSNAYWDEMDEQAIFRGQMRPIYENALAYYSTVDGVDVTWMRRAAEAMRPEGFVHFDNLNFGTLTTYNGEATEPNAPYFQLRTMLTPWYQRTWTEVLSWGALPQSARALVPGGVLSSAYATETLKSYFVVQADGTVAIGAMQKDAPYFKLVTNSDETYSIQDVASGRFLGVTSTVVNGENLIGTTGLVVGDPEKFQLRTTGVGRYYLVHDGRLVKIAVDGSTSAPNDATLTLRLGTQAEAASTDTTPENSLLFSYAPDEDADKSAVQAHDSTLTTADSWNPVANIDAATDHLGAAVTDLSKIGVTGTVDTTTPGHYTVTYHSGTATDTVTVTVVPAVTAPGAPTGLTVGLGNASAKITWMAPAANGGAPITGYTVIGAPGGKTCTTTGALSCTITGLTNGKSYTFTATATNSAGTSAPSAATAPATPTYPPGTTGNVSVSVSAKAQCINNKPSLSVYVLNKESVPVNLVITTAFGNKTVTGLAAGAATYQTLTPTGTSMGAGIATIAATKAVNGTPVTTSYEAGYQPISCG